MSKLAWRAVSQLKFMVVHVVLNCVANLKTDQMACTGNVNFKFDS